MSFSRKKKEFSSNNPIDLFSQLKRSDKFQGLIHPQVPLLKKYYEAKDDENISIQLTTGGGKTLIGLLIAEWRRRPPLSERVLYLTPTRQLANQVSAEAEQLGIPAVVLHGKFQDYDNSDCRKYTKCEAIAISNYTSFFSEYTRFKDGIESNGIGAPDCLICDDAHAADNYISSQWSIQINRSEDPFLYHRILDIFRDYLPSDIYENINDDSIFNTRSELIPSILTIQNHKRIKRVIKQYITKKDHPNLYYPFLQIHEKLECCQIFISNLRILIRPWITPSWTHKPYFESKQKIFLSATLGENSDLERIFGVHPITNIMPDDEFKGRSVGQRLIFSISSMKEGKNIKNVSEFWKNISQKFPKSLLLAPTDDKLRSAREICDLFDEKLTSKDIEVSLDKFKNKSNVILTLTRYDGIDLVGCPLLIFWHVPKAVNIQESFLGESLGEQNILKIRTRTRIIQGLGRCTRRDKDRTLVLLVGGDFTNLLLDKYYLNYFPNQLKAEIENGLEWSEQTYDEISELIEYFKQNTPEWQEAFSSILKDTENKTNEKISDKEELINLVQHEINFMKNLWSNGYDDSIKDAEFIVNNLGEDNKLYRAWWNYLSGHAAYLKYSLTQSEEYLKQSLSFFNKCRLDSVESAPIWIHSYFDDITFQKISDKQNEQINNFQLNSKALIIGIDKYEDDQFVLDRCIYDANSIKKILVDPDICGYRDSNVHHLENPTKQEIYTHLNLLIKTIGENSTVFIYFSGHGCHKDGKSYLMPREYNSENFNETTISGDDFKDYLSKINTDRLVVVLDACHSGGLIDHIGKSDKKMEKMPIKGLTKEFIDAISASKGHLVISSSSEDEASLILAEYQCSLFTHFLCKALKGETEDEPIYDKDGFIRIFPVFNYVSNKTREYNQNPYFSGKTSDFPIALYRGGKIE